jgi:hypothetical protein
MLTAAAVAATAGAASPGDRKPFVEPGTRPDPANMAGEQRQGPRPDDKYADVRLDVDKHGRPTRCRIVRSDIPDPYTRLQVCQTFMEDWHIEPLIQDGKAVPQVVTRHMVLAGRRDPIRR